MNVLISLHRGYGLGDAVQMSAVLRHVAAARPNWIIDYQAEAGKHCVGRGIVANTFEYGKNPDPNKHYDAEAQILLYDTMANWHDRPNTRVSSCLHERFGLPWDHKLGRYVVNVSSEAKVWAERRVHSNSVALHYQGDSSKAQKDLTHDQADSVTGYIDRLGYNTYLLGRHMMWGYDAEANCAAIQRCKAFVGIDSGPSKCASSTNTPALVVWTGHHPSAFHDPASNTTHLVPVGYERLFPVIDDSKVIEFFEENYNVLFYEGDPVSQIKAWLERTLK